MDWQTLDTLPLGQEVIFKKDDSYFSGFSYTDDAGDILIQAQDTPEYWTEMPAFAQGQE